MHCIRLARAFTGRQKLLKFEGNFHGYHDQVMFAIGTPADQLGPERTPTPYPGSTGIAAGLAEQIVLVPYNRADLLEAGVSPSTATNWPRSSANRSTTTPAASCRAASSWPALRELTTQNGVLLIFDEVLSAFRMGLGGAQEYLGVTPDLCTLGKAVGGGYPLSVFGGRRDIMDRLMPIGDCQHCGTYNGHPPSSPRRWPPSPLIGSPASTITSTPSPKLLFDGLTASVRQARQSTPGCRGWAPASASTSA